MVLAGAKEKIIVSFVPMSSILLTTIPNKKEKEEQEEKEERKERTNTINNKYYLMNRD